ncbi:hypothetical protein JQX13_00520 [Archangium violaceum]|nr:hypothetical protein JQX13_00520 [Archangium violaceum]
MPGLHTHECSVGRPGGFVERLRRGTYLAHICEHVTLALQNEMGFDVGYGRARGTGETGVYTVVIAYEEEEPAREAFKTALEMTLAAMLDEPYDAAAAIERLREIADEYRLGPSTRAIVDAARRRKIPVRRLTPTGSLVQLGYGIHQKRILASQTSDTSALAVEICQEKPLTNRVLRNVAQGLNPALIVRALTTFRSDHRMVPGRFNVLGLAGRQVILDYGHNVGAMRAIAEALPRDTHRRTLMVMGLPGDRRDEDILATTQASLPFVDEYVFHDLKDRRGRAELEIPQLMRSCLASDTPHHFAADQREGILLGFQLSRPGDRLVIIADLVEEALEVLEALADVEVGEEGTCEAPVSRSFE